MRQTLPAFLLAAIGGLAACTNVTSTTTETITDNGRTYEIRTQIIDGPNGPYEHSSVIVNGVPYVCKPESPGDCAGAASRASNRGDR